MGLGAVLAGLVFGELDLVPYPLEVRLCGVGGLVAGGGLVACFTDFIDDVTFLTRFEVMFLIGVFAAFGAILLVVFEYRGFRRPRIALP